MPSLPIFPDTRARTLWVQAQLRHKGLSFAAIGAAQGWSRWAVANAMSKASYPQELAIAAALGVDVQALFPERYDRFGVRLHSVRHSTANGDTCNVKHEEAA